MSPHNIVLCPQCYSDEIVANVTLKVTSKREGWQVNTK